MNTGALDFTLHGVEQYATPDYPPRWIKACSSIIFFFLLFHSLLTKKVGGSNFERCGAYVRTMAEYWIHVSCSILLFTDDLNDLGVYKVCFQWGMNEWEKVNKSFRMLDMMFNKEIINESLKFHFLSHLKHFTKHHNEYVN